VVGIIVPFNYPVNLSMLPLVRRWRRATG